LWEANLIVTSPPYNLGKDYEVVTRWEDYSTKMVEWMDSMYELSAPDARLCLNVPLDTNFNGGAPVFAEVVRLAKMSDWKYRSTIIWNEGNISRRTAWGSWKSASAPYVIAPVECIAVFYKRNWKRTRRGVSDITRDEFMAWTNGLWSFNGESAKRIGHPSPFPEELPRRCIKLFSYVDDVVMDPFMGSGTTCKVARELGRPSIGIDVEERYVKLARKRVFG
jgi:site-specific DNA-methyltransferase (adenine-specific)